MDTAHTFQNRRGLSAALILLAAVCWGVIGLFSRALSAGGLSPVQITAVRCTLTALLLTLWLALFRPAALRVRLRDLWMFFGTGICSILFFNVCYFYTQSVISLSAAAILLYTSPFFVMLISAVVFRERITPRKLIALFVAFAGCVLINLAAGGGEAPTSLAILTGVGSGLGYGLYSIFAKLAMERYEMPTITAYTFLFAAAGAVPLCRPAEAARILSAEPRLLLFAALLAVVSTLAPFILYTKGLSMTEPGRAAVLACAEPVVAACVGLLCFHEALSPAKLGGIALVIAAVILLSRTEKGGK